MDKDVRTTDLRTCHDAKFFPGGYYFYVSADDLMMKDYYVQDYQGNNRMVVHQYMGSDFVGQTTHYYPFGGVIGDISTNQSLQDYKYSGKEFDRTYGLDFYDFHARQYDPKVPRFTSIDPKTEDYYGISPYVYCAGDPVNCVDPKGEDVCVLIEQDGARGFGHMAILIQHDDQRWYLYSKNGTTEHSGIYGTNNKKDTSCGNTSRIETHCICEGRRSRSK
jgi:RHS repeat-associated protein